MDSWDPTVTHPSIDITFDEDWGVECVERKDEESKPDSHCYGTDIIEKGMKTRWTFKFVKGYASGIGIIDNDQVNDPCFIDSDKNFTQNGKGGAYALSTLNKGIYPGSKDLARLSSYKFNEGDTLKMELDMTHSDGGILAFLVGDDEVVKDDNIARTDIDITKKFRLCVVFWRSGTRIALIETTNN